MKLAELEESYARKQRQQAEEEQAAAAALEAEHARILQEIVTPAVIAYFSQLEHAELGEYDLDATELAQVLTVSDRTSYSYVWQIRVDGLTYPAHVRAVFNVPGHVPFYRDLDFDGQVCKCSHDYYLDGWHKSLPEVLSAAAQRFAEEQERVHVAELREQAQREAEAGRSVQAAREEAERKALFSWVERDAIAMALLRVFVAIDREREHWVGRIENAEQAASNLEYQYGERTAQLLRELTTARSQAADDAQRAQDAEYALEDERRRARR